MKLAIAIAAAVSVCALEVIGGHFPNESDDFLMVIGGQDQVDKIGEVELVSLDPASNPVPECLNNLASLPYAVAGLSAGMTSDGFPLVCGGFTSPMVSPLCFSYNPFEDRWAPTGAMDVAKGNSAYGTSPAHGLLMVGGSGEFVYDISESTLDGETFTTHEPLPTESVSGCLAFLDEDNFIYAGGWDTNLTSKGNSRAYIFNMTSGAVVRLPDMPYGTFGHGCGVVERGDSSSKEFVAVSGYEFLLQELQVVQIYSLEDGAWRIGNDFLPIAYARSAPYSGSFVMVGGYSRGDYLDTVYYYEPELDSFRLLESRLERVKENVAPIMVKKSMFPDCI